MRLPAVVGVPVHGVSSLGRRSTASSHQRALSAVSAASSRSMAVLSAPANVSATETLCGVSAPIERLRLCGPHTEDVQFHALGTMAIRLHRLEKGTPCPPSGTRLADATGLSTEHPPASGPDLEAGDFRLVGGELRPCARFPLIGGVEN